MKSLYRQLQYIPILFFILATASCGGQDEKNNNGDILVKIGDSKLTREQLNANIPGGITPDDSAKLARAYIRTWIEQQLITEVAAQNIDMDKIDELVAEYRNDLIMWEYSRLMYDSNSTRQLCEDSLKAHYNANKQRYRLSTPLIKGIYIKVEATAPRLSQLRKWSHAADSNDVDNIEKYALSGVIHFDDFRNNWIDWSQVEARIPHDFGDNPDYYIRNNKHLDTTVNGYTYILDIAESLPAGSIMPFELAKEIITDELINKKRQHYDRDLRRQLYEEALKDGKIEIFCDIGS